MDTILALFLISRPSSTGGSLRREIVADAQLAAAGIRRTRATVQIQLNTDRNIEGTEELAAHVTGVVRGDLGDLGEQVTRVEVHLSDVDGDRNGQDDKRCMMEARLEGRQPIAVTHRGPTVEQAIDGAIRKLKRVVESAVRE